MSDAWLQVLADASHANEQAAGDLWGWFDEDDVDAGPTREGDPLALWRALR